MTGEDYDKIIRTVMVAKRNTLKSAFKILNEFEKKKRRETFIVLKDLLNFKKFKQQRLKLGKQITDEESKISKINKR